MMKKRFIFLVAVIVVLAHQWPLLACTGITLHSKDSAYVLARTIEWGGSDLNSRYVIVPRFYDNTLGVLTNSPGFEWQMTNLNNYVNLYPGSAKIDEFRNLKLAPFGAGSGFLGLPGDVTPPSRFVRAAFYQSTAPQQNTALETVLQGFQILNNFDIPIDIEFSKDEDIADIPSAIQWTSVTDLKNRKIYYRTMYNSAIRCIDLNTINFEKIKYRDAALDGSKLQPVHTLNLFN